LRQGSARQRTAAFRNRFGYFSECGMANEEVNTGRRRFLTATTAVVGAVGAGFAAVPFIKSWSPSARARFAGAPVSQDISALAEGAQMVINWRGQPIFIARRSKAMLDILGGMDAMVADPQSGASVQPQYAQNATRSIKPEISVLVGVCTHLGCAPEFLPEVKPEPFDPDWKGGYFCPCHKSRYDLAGRVYKAQPAPLNLPVPPYHFENDTTVVIGVDPKGAA
jgi:ubiquinol-cytochrome c reductase iron-sulfur subunit